MADVLPQLHSSSANSSNTLKRMEITIHVCDESKNLKKDFTCPRDLLLNEMKYFQDYLSHETEKWEDVDISVHCDVKIFNWLIKYVKRKEEEQEPILDIHNVVSILISSDFLKMEGLVDKCVQHCHDNLSAIIATPCNMNCVNDQLVARIARTFDQHTLEQVKDRKDKFKSKLFSKLIEQLFDEHHSSKYSPNNASRLFKCLYCEKLILPGIQGRLECSVDRTILDCRGNITYKHSRDPNWDVSEFILTLRQQMKTWRNVYWKLWSLVNYFECRICSSIFPLCEYKSCLYHPQAPFKKIDELSKKESYVHPCCDRKVILFEPIQRKTGCQYRNHQIEYSEDQLTCSKSNAALFLNSVDVYEELVRVMDLVCVTKPILANMTPSFHIIENMFKTDERNIRNEQSNVISKDSEKKERKKSPTRRALLTKKRSLTAKHRTRIDTAEEDNESDEQGIFRVVIHQKDSSSSLKNRKKTWNTELPSRLNQDMQRESDLIRMNELLTNLSLTNTSASERTDRVETFNGGIFHRLETRLKTNLLNAQTVNSVTNVNPQSNRRSKVSGR